MSEPLTGKLKARWGNLSPLVRTTISLVALFGVLALLAKLILPGNKNAAQNTTTLQQRTSETNLILPQRKDTSLEGLAAGQEAIKIDQQKAAQAQADKDRQIEDLKKQLLGMSSKNDGDQQGLSREVANELTLISGRIEALEKGKLNPADALPSPDKNPVDKNKGQSPAQETAVAAPVAPSKPKVRIIGAIDEKQDIAQSDESKPNPYLTSGSLFEGNLINGMDAPTSSIAQKNPTPALIRVKTDAILPNRNDLDVKECFVVVSGFGVMATERAQLRTETLSCIKENGEVIEAKLDGYVVGEDGKVGLRGRLVSRQGSLLAKSLMSGFLGGFSAAMVPAPVPQLNTMPGLTQQYQTPNLSMAAEAGAAQGLSNSTKMLAQFYLDMAKEMFPVIEIDAGRRVTIILVHGVELVRAK